MRTKKLMGLGLILAVLLLAGCAGEFHTDLYVQDILDVATGEEEYLLTTGSLILESPGEEFNERLKEILEETFREVKNFRQGGEEYSSKVLVDLKLPILHLDSSVEEAWIDEALAIVVLPPADGVVDFGLMLNGEKIDGVFASFLEDAFYTVGVKDFSFSITLHNDLRNSIPVVLHGVYADGWPLHYRERFTLERRDQLELRLGEIARDYAYDERYVFFGELEIEE